jgi:protein phosphatase
MLETIGVGQSVPGKMRDQNEDRLLLDDHLGLYVVCDGIGGHPHGDLAAELALRTIVQTLEEARPSLHAVRSRQAAPSVALAEVRRAVERANAFLYAQCSDLPSRLRMGTTVALLLAAGWRAIVATVGDSRIYRLRDHRIQQLSRDHTVAQKMVRSGLLSEEAASGSRFHSVLTRSIGTQSTVTVDSFDTELRSGDRFLLCSDGLTDHFEDDDALLARHLQGELGTVPGALIELANRRDGHDNATALVVDVLGKGLHSEKVHPPARPIPPTS